MAKQKLNKRVVIILIVAGVVLLGGLAGGFYYLRNKDPQGFENKGDAALKAGRYKEARDNFGLAHRYSDKGTDAQNRRYYKYIKTLLAWAENDPDLTQNERWAKIREARSKLHQLLTDEPDNDDARMKLLELIWPGEGKTIAAYTRFAEQARHLLRRKPDSPKIQYQYAYTRSREAGLNPKLDKEAMDELEKAEKLNPDDPAVLQALAEHHERMARAEDNMQRLLQAEKIYQRALEELPDNAEIRLAYGQFLRRFEGIHPEMTRQEARRKSLNLFDQASRLSPEKPSVWYTIAVYHQTIGELDKARQILQKCLEIDPTFRPAYQQLALLERQSGKPEQALEILTTGIELFEKKIEQLAADQWQQAQQNRAKRLQLMMTKADLLLSLAVSGKNREENASQAKAIIEKVDKSEYALQEQPEYKYLQARLAWVNNELATATRLLEEVFKTVREGGNPRKMLEVGGLLFETYLKQGAPTKARSVQEALAANPNLAPSMQVRLMRAIVLERENRPDEARQIVETILLQDPDNQYALSIRERLDLTASSVIRESRDLYEQGLVDQAVEVLETAFAKDPTDKPVMAELINHLQRLGEEQKVRAVLAKAIEANPDDNSLKQIGELLQEKDPEKRLAMQVERIDQQFADNPLRRKIATVQLYVNAGRGEKVAETIQELEAEHGDDPLVQSVLYRVALSNQEWDKALRWAERSIQDQGKLRLRLRKPQILIRKAAALLNDKPEEARLALDDAVVQLRSLIEQSVLPEVSLTQLGRCYLLLASLEPENRESYVKQAATALDNALEYDRNSVDAVRLKLEVARLQRDTDSFRRLLDRAIKLDPHSHSIRLMWLNSLESTASREELLRQRERFERETQGEYPQNTIRLARLYEQAGQTRNAANAYARYFANADNKLAGFIALGRFLRRQGHSADVDRYYGRMLKQAESDEQKLGVKLAFVNVLEETDPALAFGFLRDDIANDPAYKDHPAVLSKLARENAQRSNWSRAAQLVQRYLDTVESPSDDFRRLHVLYRIKAGQYDRAEQLLEQLPAETVAEKAFVAQQRAQIFEEQAGMKLGQEYQDLLGKAEELYTKAISLNPQNFRSLVLRAQFYSRTGQTIKAIRDAQAAEQLTDASEVQLLLAELLAASGQTGRAEDIYRQVLTSNPSQQVYGQLLGLYLNDEDWRRLEQTVAECKKLYPKDPGYDLLLAQSYEIRARQARNANEARQLARARLQAIQSARQTAPDSPAAAMAMAQALLDNRMYDQLLEYVQSVSKNTPQLAGNLKLYRGLALAGKGRSDAAKAVYAEFIISAGPRQLQAGVDRIRRSFGRDVDAFLASAAGWVEKRPDDPVLLTTIAGAIVNAPTSKEHSRQAKAYLETALAQTQDANLRATAQAILGQTWYNLGQYTKSRDAYLAALQVQPDNITALNNLAYVYAENLDDPSRALPFARRAARIEPENPSILDTYAWTLARTGRYEEALAPMEQAVRLAAESSAGLLEYHLGYIHEQLGHLRSAQRTYQSALQRESTDAETREKIQQGLSRVQARMKQQEEQG